SRTLFDLVGRSWPATTCSWTARLRHLGYTGNSPHHAGDCRLRLLVVYLEPVNYQKRIDRKSTRLNSSHVSMSYAVFCLKKKINSRMTWEKRAPAPRAASARRTTRPCG